MSAPPKASSDLSDQPSVIRPEYQRSDTLWYTPDTHTASLPDDSEITTDRADERSALHKSATVSGEGRPRQLERRSLHGPHRAATLPSFIPEGSEDSGRTTMPIPNPWPEESMAPSFPQPSAPYSQRDTPPAFPEPIHSMPSHSSSGSDSVFAYPGNGYGQMQMPSALMEPISMPSSSDEFNPSLLPTIPSPPTSLDMPLPGPGMPQAFGFLGGFGHYGDMAETPVYEDFIPLSAMPTEDQHSPTMPVPATEPDSSPSFPISPSAVPATSSSTHDLSPTFSDIPSFPVHVDDYAHPTAPSPASYQQPTRPQAQELIMESPTPPPLASDSFPALLGSQPSTTLNKPPAASGPSYNTPTSLSQQEPSFSTSPSLSTPAKPPSSLGPGLRPPTVQTLPQPQGQAKPTLSKPSVLQTQQSPEPIKPLFSPTPSTSTSSALAHTPSNPPPAKPTAPTHAPVPAKPPAAAPAPPTQTLAPPPKPSVSQVQHPLSQSPSPYKPNPTPAPSSSSPDPIHSTQLNAKPPAKPSPASAPSQTTQPPPKPTPPHKPQPEKVESSPRPPKNDIEQPQPGMTHTNAQLESEYVNMLLALDDIPQLHSLAANFFTWILLAGFILFPGTFDSIQTSGSLDPRLVNAVKHVPLYVIAWVCTAIGIAGMIWLTWRWHRNYIWCLNKIFMPGFLNSLAGLLSTLANLFGVQKGDLVTSSKVTVIVVSAATGVTGILTIIYALWLVRRVKAKHDRTHGRETTGKFGEGAIDTSARKEK